MPKCSVCLAQGSSFVASYALTLPIFGSGPTLHLNQNTIFVFQLLLSVMTQ